MISEPSAPPVPLCKDCKHFLPDPYAIHQCNRTLELNRVTGESGPRSCQREREQGWIDRCGPDGKNFEPKD